MRDIGFSGRIVDFWNRMRSGGSRDGMRWVTWTGLLLVTTLTGCTYEREGPVSQHYVEFKTQPPRGNTVYVCHAYGCNKQTKFRFTETDIATLRDVMKKARNSDDAKGERRAVAYAVAWMETRVGKEIGTDKDRPGMDFNASGDPTQQDCVDEATNTTTYLTVLDHNGLLKHPTLTRPMSKENLLRGVAGWPHWTAVLVEKPTGQRWAVDSWIYANGENPAIVETEKWYIDTLDNLPIAMR
jgi:hypothetical protein